MGRIGALILLAAGAAFAVLLGLRFGAVSLGVGDVIEALRGTGEPTSVTIVRDLRLPRVVLGALVGGALGLAGATFQALLRNPLADPYVLGVSSGAAVGAVVAIGLGWVAVGRWALPGTALVGAVAAILLVMRIGTGVNRRLDMRVLLLAGVVAGTFFNACVLLLLSLQETDAFRSAMFWMMGSLAGASWSSVVFLGIVVAGAFLWLLGLSRALNLLAVGEESAGYLGVPVARIQRSGYLVASVLTAAAVVTAGGIGFVGLVVPHSIRLVWGGEHRFLLPATFLAGAGFLPLADLVARLVAAPGEVPLGVVTAFLGVPFFVVLLRRQFRGGGT